MANQLIKAKGMVVLEQEFDGDMILTVKLKDTNKVYVGVKQICNNIGLTEDQTKRQLKNIKSDLVLNKGVSNLTLPTKGGNQIAICIELEYMPLWLAKISITPDMINNKQDVVETLVAYQLKAKDVLAQAFLGKQKEWNLQREVGKADRNRLTNSIKEYHDNPKFYTYSNYTDMVYQVLFGMKAKEIRETRNIEKKSDLTRDYLTEYELKQVDEAETIVTALTTLGFKYDYIKDQLERKYIKRIESI